MTYDGSIRIDTQIDTDGVDKGLADIQNKTKKTKTAFDLLNDTIKTQEKRLIELCNQYSSLVINNQQNSTAAKKLKNEIKTLSTTLKGNKAAAESAAVASQKAAGTMKTAFTKVGNTLKTVASYLIGIQTIFALINFSKDASNAAIEHEASIQRLVDIYGEASHAVGDFIDSGARALGMSKSAAASYAAVYGNLFSVWADQATNADLTNHYLNMTAVVASKTGREVSDVQERIRSGLLGNTEAIEDLGIFVNVKTIEMTDAFKRMADGKSWEQLDAYSQQQIRTMAILEQATEKYGTEVAETTTLTRMRFQAAYKDFQNTWGQVVNTVMIPLLEIGTMVLNVLTKGLQAIAKISGKTVDTTVSQSDAISSSVDNQNALTDAVKETAKAQKGALAGFDEINTLSQETAGNSGGTSASGIADLGLGELDSSFNGSSVVEEVDSTLTAIMGIVGISLAALGVILLFTGHIGWGLGFIIAGAALFAVTMATMQDDSISQTVKDKLANAVILTGIVAVAIGILLCFCQQWGIGIGLIAIGVASIVTAVALNWDGIKEQMQGTFGGVLAIVGIVAIVIGILLCCAQVWGLGIGAIVLGATALISVVVVNWNAITDAITGFFRENAGLIVGVSLALLILGIILLVTGVGIPIGLGLILAGVGGLAAIVALNWDFILDKIKEVWNKIKAFWDKHIAPIFTKEWWLNLAKTIGNGFIAGIEGMINGVISMFEKMINWIVKGLNKISFDVPDWVPGIGGKTFGFNLSTVDFGKVSIPRLATGAVIPPNQEFLAVLGDQKRGTNIEAPLDTIKQAVAEVLAQVNMNNSNGSKMTITIPVYLNGREIARAERDAENEMGKQTVFGGFANAY